MERGRERGRERKERERRERKKGGEVAINPRFFVRKSQKGKQFYHHDVCRRIL